MVFGPTLFRSAYTACMWTKVFIVSFKMIMFVGVTVYQILEHCCEDFQPMFNVKSAPESPIAIVSAVLLYKDLTSCLYLCICISVSAEGVIHKSIVMITQYKNGQYAFQISKAAVLFIHHENSNPLQHIMYCTPPTFRFQAQSHFTPWLYQALFLSFARSLPGVGCPNSCQAGGGSVRATSPFKLRFF